MGQSGRGQVEKKRADIVVEKNTIRGEKTSEGNPNKKTFLNVGRKKGEKRSPKKDMQQAARRTRANLGKLKMSGGTQEKKE